jgi:imidazolonepropionase-like amidohydrolase
MQRKNIVLISVVAVAGLVFAFPELSALLPGWPGYRIGSFIRWNDPVIAMNHVRIIDGTGASPIEDGSVVVANGTILSAGPASQVAIPPTAKVLDFRGYTVIPGLVGMHDHLFYPVRGGAGGYKEMGFSFPRLYLAAGVTTIRLAGSIQPDLDLRLKHQIDRGWLAGPSIEPSGPYLNEWISPEQARQMVDDWAARGVKSFKAYTNLSSSALSAAIDAAHKRGLKITGHLCAVGFREAASLGIDNLEHGLILDSEFVPGKRVDDCPAMHDVTEAVDGLDLENPAVRGLIDELIRHHVAVTSTLPVFETLAPFRSPVTPRVLGAMDASARREYLDIRNEVNHNDRSRWNSLLLKEMQFERQFVQAGGMLLAGVDPTGNGGNLAGFGDQRELELLVEAGFTPLEALHIATENGARFLGEADRIGTIAPGKQADLALVKGNPAANINEIENVEYVFKHGVGYDSAKLIASVRGAVGRR